MKFTRLRKNKKLVLLGCVIFVYSLIVIPLFALNTQNRQDTRSRAQVTQEESETSGIITPQSAYAQCTAGKVDVGVSYTNIDTTQSITVEATDLNTPQSVNLGEIVPGETKTSVIPTSTSNVPAGEVQFVITKAGTTSQQTAPYTARDCLTVSNTSLQSIPTPTPATSSKVCGNVTTDTMMLTDTSGSMGQNNKLIQAKNAGSNFIDVIAKQESTNRVGLATFATTGTLNSPLTTNYSSVKSSLSALSAKGTTCMECGINKANDEIKSHGRPNVKKVVVLLTDGIANTIEGSTKQVSTAVAEQKALDAAIAGHNNNGTVFFVIGFGNDVNKPFLQKLATQTGGKFYFPLPSELDSVYQEISQLIGKGIVSGYFFNDANVNGHFDQGEQKVSGWSVKLSSSTGTQTLTSDSTGQYTFIGLCDGSYKVSEIAKAGWSQTMPTDPNGYALTITNASQFTDENFGNTDKSRCSDEIDNDNNGFIDAKDSTCHTDGNPNNPNSYDPKKDGEHGGNTCADSKDNNGNGLIDGADPVCHTGGDPKNPWDPTLPEVTPQTTISLTLLLDGIGSRGDNTNPDGSLSNKKPQHANITANVLVYDVNNKIVATKAATVKYATASGTYIGKIVVDKALNGKYSFKVGTNKYLTKLLANFQTIEPATDNKITPVSLVAGDINVDNRLNILDYNLLLNCYSDIRVAVNCSSLPKNISADITDDGHVNATDYNLFLREITTQPGH